MAELRSFPGPIEVAGNLTNGGVRVPTISSTSTFSNKTHTAPIINKATLGTITVYTGATDAIDISLGDVFVLNRSGAVDAATLAPPAAGDNGRVIYILNGAAQANTITITEGIGGSGASYDVLTFTNVVGGCATLIAYNAHWHMAGQYLVAVA